MSGAPSIKAEGTVPVLCFCRVCVSIREIYAVMAMAETRQREGALLKFEAQQPVAFVGCQSAILPGER